MAQQGRLEVKGGANLRRTLKNAGDDLLNDLKQTHKDVASLVTPAARARAPKRSGKLAASVRPGATKSAAIIRAGSGRVPYAGVQEWGWGRRHIASQPFMSPAARQTESAWKALYTERVNEILSKVRGV